MTIIDVTPLGWCYGFPRELPDDVKDIYGWLMECGYPEQLVAHCSYKTWAWEEKNPSEKNLEKG